MTDWWRQVSGTDSFEGLRTAARSIGITRSVRDAEEEAERERTTMLDSWAGTARSAIDGALSEVGRGVQEQASRVLESVSAASDTLSSTLEDTNAAALGALNRAGEGLGQAAASTPQLQQFGAGVETLGTLNEQVGRLRGGDVAAAGEALGRVGETRDVLTAPLAQAEEARQAAEREEFEGYAQRLGGPATGEELQQAYAMGQNIAGAGPVAVETLGRLTPRGLSVAAREEARRAIASGRPVPGAAPVASVVEGLTPPAAPAAAAQVPETMALAARTGVREARPGMAGALEEAVPPVAPELPGPQPLRSTAALPTGAERQLELPDWKTIAPDGEVKDMSKLDKGLDWLQRARYVNLLSGPAYAVGDLVSNAINVPRLAYRTAVGAGIERLANVPRQQRATVAAELDGMRSGMLSGAAQGLREGLEMMWQGGKAVASEQPRTLIPGPAGAIPEFGARLRIASDLFWRHVGRTSAAHMLAHREAFREGVQYGTPEYTQRVTDLADAITTRVARGDVTQGGVAVKGAGIEALAKEAEALAARQVFQQDLTGMSKGLASLRGGAAPGQRDTGGPLGLLVPFFKTMANIAAEGVTMTPGAGTAGLGYDVARGLRGRGPYARTAGDRSAWLTRSGSPAVLPASQRIAEQSAGLGAMAFTGALTVMGLYTGNGPDNPQEMAALRETGWLPQSFRFGPPGQEVYLPVDRYLGPLAYPMVLGAAVAEHYERTGQPVSERLLGDMARSFGTYWFRNGGLEAFGDLLELGAKSGDPAAFGQAAQELIAQTAGQAVPLGGLLRQVVNANDPVLRDPKTAWERLAAGIPGLQEQVPERRARSGEVLERPGGQRGARAFLPFQTSEQRTLTARYTGSPGGREDVRIARAIEKVRAYFRRPDTMPEPSDAEMNLYYDYVGQENPEYTAQRREELARQREATATGAGGGAQRVNALVGAVGASR